MTSGTPEPGGSGLAGQFRPVRTAPPLWREIALGLVAFGVYSVIAGLNWSGRPTAADREGWRILALERALHIPLEEPLNAWLAPHQVLRVLANYEYAFTYIVSALILLGWLYLRRPDTYRWARSSFLLMNAIALAFFALYPVTPPRLLVGAGFVDTVRLGRTWGSWGSPMVEHANQLAAMPSLHIGWAVWVSLVLACVSGARWIQALSAAHVLLTAAVIMATANHYLLDAVGGVLLVWVTIGLMDLVQDRPGGRSGPRVAAADAFFLYAESPAAPQHVGGLLILDEVPAGKSFRDLVRDRLEAGLPQLPRFQQRLFQASRWRRPRWVYTTSLDWDWHVQARDVSGPDGEPGGMAALHALVAEVQSTPLPRDRPLWRYFAVTGAVPGQVAIVLVVHHAVSDGIGTVAQATSLMVPVPPPVGSQAARISPLRRLLGIIVGLAQLATDGGSRHRLLPGGTGEGRRFATIGLPLSTVRRAAREQGVRVSDLLLTAVASAVRQLRPGPELPRALRVSVPLMVREPATAPEGNVTAAVMLDVQLGAMSDQQRLADTRGRSGRLYTGTRALASRFVISTACALLPPPVHAWFARTVYGHRFFQAIISNMPGPPEEPTMVGATVRQVFPILPLAPGAPLAVGALGWGPMLNVGISVDPALVDDAEQLADAIRRVIDDLTPSGPVRSVVTATAVHSAVHPPVTATNGATNAAATNGATNAAATNGATNAAATTMAATKAATKAAAKPAPTRNVG
jgi:diacylglycerol O-acyltransferase / wax synthase